MFFCKDFKESVSDLRKINERSLLFIIMLIAISHTIGKTINGIGLDYCNIGELIQRSLILPP